MTHPLETSPMREPLERMNAPTMFRDNLGAWLLATLFALGAVIAASTFLVHWWPLEGMI